MKNTLSFIAERKQIDASVFYTRWGYNAAGLQSWMRYPGGAAGESGELVTMTYLPQRLLNALSGTDIYVQGTTYDAAGRADVRTLGSNVLKTDYDYYPWSQQGGRLKTLKSGLTGSPTSLQSFVYDYDPVGNIDWIKDYNAGGTQTQNFTYDSLDRLRAASASGGTGGTYSESYTYNDTTGNLASKSGVGDL